MMALHGFILVSSLEMCDDYNSKDLFRCLEVFDVNARLIIHFTMFTQRAEAEDHQVYLVPRY